MPVIEYLQLHVSAEWSEAGGFSYILCFVLRSFRSVALIEFSGFTVLVLWKLSEPRSFGCLCWGNMYPALPCKQPCGAKSPLSWEATQTNRQSASHEKWQYISPHFKGKEERMTLMWTCWIPAQCLCTITSVLLFLCFIGCTYSQWPYAAVLGNCAAWLYSHQLTEMWEFH